MHDMKFPNGELSLELMEQIVNPTGGRQTPTPWKAHDLCRGICRYAIRDGNLVTVARFNTREDRDFALFWVNSHAGLIGILNQMAQSFRFIEHGTEEVPTKHIARNSADLTEIWHEFFRTLGASAREYRDEEAH
jgi:hypothetical protein